MKHGFVKVAAATPSVKLADCSYNSTRILDLVSKASECGVHLLVLPELCVTGCTSADLFYQQTLLDSARESISEIARRTPRNMVLVFGAPLEVNGRIYDCAFVSCSGKLLAAVPKAEKTPRWFAGAPEEECEVQIGDFTVPFSKNILFSCSDVRSFVFGIDINDGTLTKNSIALAESGATVLCRLSSADDRAGRLDSLRCAINAESSRLKCCTVYSSSGDGESTTDSVYSGFSIISENGENLACESENEDELLLSEADTQCLANARRKDNLEETGKEMRILSFDLEMGETDLSRHVNTSPFLPEDPQERERCCAEILNLQARGLRRRLEHTRSKTVVIGISGGLDSTLAILATVKAFEDMGMSRRNIFGISMPCFGTTQRTKSNAQALTESLGCSFAEINITEAVKAHFKDIEQSETDYNTTFENAQARERTQVLMDLANKYNGLVVGTGDLSELALGWATYNGDHMSMYGVNAGVPKTVAREVVAYYASYIASPETAETLRSILDTPISPELIPGKQETENIVGPYELHDFFIYHTLKNGFSPSKIYRLALYAFDGEYDGKTIAFWLKTFIRRFFSQQFKRSCMPDGPAVLDVSLSPRGSWQMASDANSTLWLKELEDYLAE
ncbi:MAG: NAD(+) synthase [Sphaerochaetaceae bacterium]|nr:NAD(+) synthase [Sphaerochaetaceae bacterium]